jgi:protease-4
MLAKSTRAVALCSLLLLTAASGAQAARTSRPFLDYRTESWFLPQSPGVTGGPAAGLFNPGAFALTDIGGADVWWNDRSVRSGLDNYGFGLGRTLNFAMNKTTYGDEARNQQVYDCQIGLAGGTRGHTLGLAYRWARGDAGRERSLVLGAVSRRRNWLSFGTAAVLSLESPAAQYVFDLGLRPFRRDYLTLSADWSVNDDETFFRDGHWGAALEVRPLNGVHAGLRAREGAGGRVDYAAVAGVTFGFTGFSALLQFDHDGHHRQTSYLLRSNPPLKGLGLPSLMPGRKTAYYPLNLENKFLTYQKYRWFDDDHVAWLDLLALLNAVRDDKDIDIVVVNLAGFSGRPSLLWEFRQKLLEIRAAGKEVIAHTDNTRAGTYYLASAADTVTMDPFGTMHLPGTALSRSYLKGTLEKLRVGFQEHRYFKYKSAVESLSRDHMSVADREQRQRIVDVIYEEMRDRMAEGRGLTADRLDAVTDTLAELTAAEAKSAGLVDEVTRWDALLRKLAVERNAGALAHVPNHYRREYWDEQWGRPVKIPVVFAVGPCDMDEGIKGRATSAYLRQLVHDPDVKAVVLRADSPGGAVMPSDLVAEAITQLREAGKPVIVSQGDVAASGGYWISMNGTEILTTPLTITGSIGVISGWLWDDGFAAKMGVTSDAVQRGRHADLFTNVSLPFLGGIPRRPMTDEELVRVEHMIRGMYGDFVAAVARGRGLDRDRVHDLAQGRVWMGGDAVANGLCDRFGTLDDALNLAREKAGIAAWREVEVVEYPPRPLIKWPSFGPRLPGLFGLADGVNRQLERWYGLTRDCQPAAAVAVPLGAPGLTTGEVEYLQSLIRTQGNAALLVGPDLLPEGWQQRD